MWQEATSPCCHVTPRGNECIRPLRVLGRHSHPLRVQCTRQCPPNVPLPGRDLDPHLTRGSLDPRESASQTASRSVQPFLHGSPVCPTHTHEQTTLRATSVAIGRISRAAFRQCGVKTFGRQATSKARTSCHNLQVCTGNIPDHIVDASFTACTGFCALNLRIFF